MVQLRQLGIRVKSHSQSDTRPESGPSQQRMGGRHRCPTTQASMVRGWEWLGRVHMVIFASSHGD